MVSITDVAKAKQKYPILMRQTAELELNDFIPLDDAYTPEEVITGYETNQLENLHLQNILEEEMERMLDDNGFVFWTMEKLTPCFVMNVSVHFACRHSMKR
jgi:hypothetical protein